MFPSLLMTGGLGKFEYVDTTHPSPGEVGDFYLILQHRYGGSAISSGAGWTYIHRNDSNSKQTGDNYTTYSSASRAGLWAADGGSTPGANYVKNRLRFRHTLGKQLAVTHLGGGAGTFSVAGLKGPVAIAMLAVRNGTSALPGGTVNGASGDQVRSGYSTQGGAYSSGAIAFWNGPFTGDITTTVSNSSYAQIEFYAVHPA